MFLNKASLLPKSPIKSPKPPQSHLNPSQHPTSPLTNSKKPSSTQMKHCNSRWLFPCMSKTSLERVHSKLKQALLLKKRERDWETIQKALRFWKSYLKVVALWLRSSNLSIIKNGKQLFSFLIGLNPAREISLIIEGLGTREKFLHQELIFLLEEFLNVLCACGAEMVYEINQSDGNGAAGIDWDQEIEDEQELVQRLQERLGTVI